MFLVSYVIMMLAMGTALYALVKGYELVFVQKPVFEGGPVTEAEICNPVVTGEMVPVMIAAIVSMVLIVLFAVL